MNKRIQLTDAERALILEERKKAAEEKRAIAFRLKAMRVAAKAFAWQEKHDYQLSFSAFVNQFNYQDDDCKKMHEAVLRIFDALPSIH